MLIKPGLSRFWRLPRPRTGCQAPRCTGRGAWEIPRVPPCADSRTGPCSIARRAAHPISRGALHTGPLQSGRTSDRSGIGQGWPRCRGRSASRSGPAAGGAYPRRCPALRRPLGARHACKTEAVLDAPAKAGRERCRCGQPAMRQVCPTLLRLQRPFLLPSLGCRDRCALASAR